jgi:heavy metal sensor kinase
VKRLSIGLRLTLWYLAIFFVGELIFGTGMWFILRKNLYDIADASLEGQAADLQRFFVARPNESLAELQKEISDDYQIERSEDYLQISTLDGNFMYRSRFLLENPLPQVSVNRLDKRRYQNRKLGKNPFRILSERVEVGGRVFGVQIAVSLDEEIETLDAFRGYLLMFAPFLLLGASGGGYWLSRRALAPVDALARTARTISGSNLSSRLEQLNTGDELQRLSDTLNEMLERIESAFLRITEFTADASHELRTPIALIHTEAELALRRSRNEAEYKEALQHILHEAERTAKLLEELLALARADSGREALDLRPIDWLATWRESAAKWNQVAALRRLQFEEHLNVQHMLVMGDANALRRVIDILLDNALKYTSSPGRVTLLGEEKEGRAVVSVEDTGIGIAQGDQTRIFERFYRVDKARSRELGGAGLGLAIAQWIVQLHHGSITVQSEPGKGSVFQVEIPLTTSILDANTPLPKPEAKP